MARLTESLVSLGYPALDSARVIAPKFSHALKGTDDKQSIPGVTIKQPHSDAARKNRREFERRSQALEFRLGRHDPGIGWIGGGAVIDAAVLFPYFAAVRNYMSNPQIRAQVLNRILAALPGTGRPVIVGHSLGSVIAADLVHRLPVGLEVVGMVAIGSPLANGNFDVDKLQDALKEPPANLSWWVNFWHPLDPVASHRGVSSVFPLMVDFRVQARASIRVHDALEYLSNAPVAEAIGFALVGSRSKELVGVNKGLDIPLDEVELFTLLALSYAHLICFSLEKDLQDRYSGALRQVQATVINSLLLRNDEERRSTPSEVARLAFDLSDLESVAPTPLPSRHIEKDEAVVLLTTLARANIIQPFEISVPKDKQQDALRELSVEMGLGSQFGVDVFIAAKRAQEALGGSRGLNWKKWGAMGVGAAALVVATGGLALAAGAGLAGVAVITSALASFGPGGMIGGLMTAGALVGAGGGGIAFGLASPGITAETLEAVVERRLATVILRDIQGLEPDLDTWRILTDIEIEVGRQKERLDDFSDESAPAIQEIKRKIDAVQQALKFLSDRGLEPDIHTI